ncbi:arylamine N-acetyltransferase family protein [Nonomuraea soli]|uniref:Arylamine N-acetyltransferase n=1 Tax=Nonomuraea soli TaxID=1032476 RepID=A0A7W0CKV0_9ACTN|nr:arylamine N-acetyltransferase [Nonomuraea soli]MBA2892832.1 arylamine N-acetyltransferase [Nonomuraea soli]
MDIAAYLTRLGRPDLLGAPATIDTLIQLHIAHIERVPYEALEIWLGRPTTVDPLESAGRILRGRGGYCYHLNGAFSELARAMGFQVTRHVGGVQTSGVEPGITANHLVLTVAFPDGLWLADLGLGDALHEPLPLVEGRYRQGPFEYGLRPSEFGWRFDHDPSGSFEGMDFGLAPAEMSAFAQKHEYLTTSPESGFVRVATVQRRDSAGVDSLRGLTLTRNGQLVATLETPGDYFAALADVFGLNFGAFDRERLWARVWQAHKEWLAAR